LSAQIVGLGMRAQASIAPLIASMYGLDSAAGTPLRSLRSAPAQNAWSPAPVSTTARTPGSSPRLAARRRSSWLTARDNALRASGRLSVTWAT
jgi:hypothetical protein